MAGPPRAPAGRTGRAVWAVITATTLLLLVAGPVAGAQSWSVSPDRHDVPLGTSAVVTLTISNTSSDSGGGSGIGCVEITIPTAFTVSGVTVASVTGGNSWDASLSGSSPRGVVAAGDSNGDRLRGSPDNDVLVLKVTVTGKLLGLYTWTANAFRDSDDSDCSGPFASPASVLLTVIGLPVPTPKPTPTPTPNATASPTPTPTRSPTQTPTPTATPMPTPTAPGATPTPTPTARPSGSASPEPSPTPSPTPTASDRPGASPTPDSSSGPTPVPGTGGAGGGPRPSGGPGSGGGSDPGPVLGFDTYSPERPSDELSTDGFAGLDFSDWAVPGLLLTGPGLLLLALVAAQAMGALAWLPVVRRRMGAFGLMSRRRPPRGA